MKRLDDELGQMDHQSIAQKVEELYEKYVDKSRERFVFEDRPPAGAIAGPAKVILLGNHSSGKSTFVNHLLGRKIQKTGEAPTDDGFTVLSFGKDDNEIAGHAAVNNGELGYTELSQFGPEFVNRFKLKRQNHPLLETVTLIDTPGMIDTLKQDSGRGYDFAKVVRWFAERADLVLVFFDPGKPGTTGETVQVLTESLKGIDHKLRIVMNQVDKFKSLYDFARTYGALCWNLGKVMPSKDLPHIYTTFVPGHRRDLDLPVEDFDEARQELRQEISNAPRLRVDNMLTQLSDYTDRLKLHATVLGDARADLSRQHTQLSFLKWFFSLLPVAAAGGIYHFKPETPIWILASLAGLGIGLFILLGWIFRGVFRRREIEIVDSLTGYFERRHHRLSMTSDSLAMRQSLWKQVHPRLKMVIEQIGLFKLPKPKSRELSQLGRIVDEEIPELRRRWHQAMQDSPKAYQETAPAITPAPVLSETSPKAPEKPEPKVEKTVKTSSETTPSTETKVPAPSAS